MLGKTTPNVRDMFVRKGSRGRERRCMDVDVPDYRDLIFPYLAEHQGQHMGRDIQRVKFLRGLTRRMETILDSDAGIISKGEHLSANEEAA